MLAEIFFLKLEAQARANEPKSGAPDPRFVPVAPPRR